MGNRTFTIIKPNAVANRHTGDILDKIEKAGFRILALKMLYLNRFDVEKFYHIHKEKSFFPTLCLFMTAGPVVVAVLEKENAVADFRALVGATDPAKSAAGTIRKLYGESMTRNAIHASDSDENAAWEASFFFSGQEIVEAAYCLPAAFEEMDKD